MRSQPEASFQGNVMFEASNDGESVFSIETAFNPFKSAEKKGGLNNSKGNTAISQQHKPFYDNFGKKDSMERHEPQTSFTHHTLPEVVVLEYPPTPQHFFRKPSSQESPKEIFFSPYQQQECFDAEPKSSPHSIPSFPIPLIPFAQREGSASPAAGSVKRVTASVLSKLPTHVSDSLVSIAPQKRSGSLLSDSACYTPTSPSKKALENSPRAKDSALHLAMQGVQLMDMDPNGSTFENKGLHEEVFKIVQTGEVRSRSIERANSFKRKETMPRSSSKTRNRISMSPKAQIHRDPDMRPPTSKNSPTPYIPLPPFSNPEDNGKQRPSAAKAAGDAKSITSTNSRGRVITPRSRKLPCNSPAGSPGDGRPKAPMREGLMMAPTKSHQLVLSSSRVRSQSPRVSKSAMDRASFGVLARSPRDGKKICDMKPPSTPKKKAKSLKDESGFSVVWQRSLKSSSHSKQEETQRSRSSSEPPVAAQRRVVGGASRRVRVDEKQLSRSNKDHRGGVASHCRRMKDPTKQTARSSNHFVWDECKRLSSCSVTTWTPKKPERTPETAFTREPASPNRFAATPAHADFPPMSPFRKCIDPDFPPLTPMRKESLMEKNSLPYCSDHDSRGLRSAFTSPQSAVAPYKSGAAPPPKQSRRRSCF